MTLYDATAYRYKADEQAVLRDLFTRIPTKDLLYGCRGATCKWHDTLLQDVGLQARLAQRADSMHMIVEAQRAADPFILCDALLKTRSGGGGDDDGDSQPIDRCIDFVKLASLKWHREIVMRAYRSASIRPLFEMSGMWKRRLESNFDDRLTKEMYECSKQAAKQMQSRVLLDSNDRMAEMRSATIERNGGTAARWQHDAECSD